MNDQTQKLPATRATASSVPSTASLALEKLRQLPDRLDDDTLANVEKFSLSPPPPLPITDRAHTLQFVRLLSDMPRRQDDDATGKIRAENIVTHLSALPRPCLDWMLREVHVRFSFFPTVKELLDLADRWRRDDAGAQARRLAAQLAYSERQARMSDARKKLRWRQCDQAWIDGLPDETKSILAAERLLRRDDAGRFTQIDHHWRDWQAFREQQEASGKGHSRREGAESDSELSERKKGAA